MKNASRAERAVVGVTYVLAGLLLAGCVPPGRLDDALINRYQQTLQKEGAQARAGRNGVDLLRPLPTEADPKLIVVPDPLTGRDAALLTLDDCIRMTVRNSLDIRLVGYDAAVSREQMIQAAAAFDWTVFASYSRDVVDERATNVSRFNNTKNNAWEVGVRELNPLGSTTELKWDMTRTNEKVFLTPVSPNPSWNSITALTITQPLLQGFGPDVNLAQLHLAQYGSKIAYAQFRQKVEEDVDQVTLTYWQLVQARGELVIQIAVLREAEDTLQKVELRTELDAAKNLEYKQTLATVKTRQANVVAARKTVSDVEDVLARLLMDSRLNTIRTYGIKPDLEEPPITDIKIDHMSEMVAAMRYNPTLEQARFAIDQADIQVVVARNGTLPVLNVKASAAPQGLDRHLSEAIEMQSDGDFIDYSVALAFEYPLGNRGPESKLRQAKLLRQKSVTDLQNTADQVSLAIDEAIRGVYVSVVEYHAQLEAVSALTDNLAALDAALEVGKQSYLLVLQLKLQAQDNRATARRAALAAQVNHRQALSRLARVTGTSLMEHHITLAVEAATDVNIPNTTKTATTNTTTNATTMP